jgi:hypothetical protein
VQGNIGSASAAANTYALNTGEWPLGTDLTLIIPAISDGTGNPANGVVAGKGGLGGGFNGGGQASVSGENGGAAIGVFADIKITNRGIIGGGGGSGSGSAYSSHGYYYRGGCGAGVPITGNGSYRYGGSGCNYNNSNYGGNLGAPGAPNYTNSCGWFLNQVNPGTAGAAIINPYGYVCAITNEGSGAVYGPIKTNCIVGGCF